MVRRLLAPALLGLSATGTGQQTGERSPAAIAFERATRIATEVTPLDPATLCFRRDRSGNLRNGDFMWDEGFELRTASPLVSRPKEIVLGWPRLTMPCGAVLTWTSGRGGAPRDVRVENPRPDCPEPALPDVARRPGRATITQTSGPLVRRPTGEPDFPAVHITLPPRFTLFSMTPPLHNTRNVAFLGYTEQGGVRTISWVRTYLNQSRR